LNYAIAFMIKSKNKKGSKKKYTMCYKCKKTGHYSNTCDDEVTVKTSNKKGSRFLLLIRQ